MVPTRRCNISVWQIHHAGKRPQLFSQEHSRAERRYGSTPKRPYLQGGCLEKCICTKANKVEVPRCCWFAVTVYQSFSVSDKCGSDVNRRNTCEYVQDSSNVPLNISASNVHAVFWRLTLAFGTRSVNPCQSVVENNSFVLHLFSPHWFCL